MGWDAACESSGLEPELISFARGGPSVTPDAGDVDLKERKEEECVVLPSFLPELGVAGACCKRKQREREEYCYM